MSYLVGSLDLEGASGYVSSVTEMADVECGDDGCQTDGPENRECYPIFVPHIDTVFGGHKRCLMFVRSLGVPSENCTPGSFTDSKLFLCIRFQDSDVAMVYVHAVGLYIPPLQLTAPKGQSMQPQL